MSVRCKMRLESVFAQAWGGSKAVFRCEYDEALVKEDREFSTSTPTGFAEFQIMNPKAAGQLVIGESYYFDISHVPAQEAKNA